MVAVSLSAYKWPLFPGDREVSIFIQSISFSGLESTMRAVSLLGSRPVALTLLFALALPLWSLGYRKESSLLFLTLVADLMNSPIKDVIGRQRPNETFVQLLSPASNGPGFPSGHAVHLMVFFGALIYILPRTVKSVFWVRLVSVFLISLILLGGISRIYLGLHWASDVIGGYLYGVFYLGLIMLVDQQWASRTARQKSLAESPSMSTRSMGK